MPKSLASLALTYMASKTVRQMRRLVVRRSVNGQRAKPGCRLKRKRGWRGWQEWELELLGKMPDRDAARETGRTLSAISSRRVELKIPAIRTRELPWTPEQIALLGKLPDKEAARLIGCYYSNVARKRLEL